MEWDELLLKMVKESVVVQFEEDRGLHLKDLCPQLLAENRKISTLSFIGCHLPQKMIYDLLSPRLANYNLPALKLILRRTTWPKGELAKPVLLPYAPDPLALPISALVIEGRTSIKGHENEISKLIRTSPTLTHLDLDLQSASEEGWMEICEALASDGKLISQVIFRGATAKTSFDQLGATLMVDGCRLTSLTLYRCSDAPETGWGMLASALSQQSSLTFLNLEKTPLPLSICTNILKEVVTNQQLRCLILELDEDYEDDEDADDDDNDEEEKEKEIGEIQEFNTALVELLNGNTTLVKLDIHKTPESHPGLVLSAEVWEALLANDTLSHHTFPCNPPNEYEARFVERIRSLLDKKLEDATWNEVDAASVSFDRIKEDLIGAGGQGQVYRGFLTTSTEVIHCAVKEINTLEATLKEVRALAYAQGPNMLKLLGASTTTSYHYYILTELVVPGSLESALAKARQTTTLLPMEMVKKISEDVLKGIHHLHTLGVVHRDIKPGNILLSGYWPDCTAKIADLGISRIIATDLVMTVQEGTHFYAAPETLQDVYSEGSKSFACYNEKVDIFSFAIMLNEMIVGSNSFRIRAEGHKEGLDSIIQGMVLRHDRPDFPPQGRCPPDVQRFVEECWDPLPANRPTAWEALQRIQELNWT